MSLKITMIGAGSPGFSRAVGEGLMRSDELDDSLFCMMDINPERLSSSTEVLREEKEKRSSALSIEQTTSRREALKDADYVVTSFEAKGDEFWLKDLRIPERHGVSQLMGENGGPGGQAHALRNIALFMDICEDMPECCPDAWLLNFTNPMSFVCTYLRRYGWEAGAFTTPTEL